MVLLHTERNVYNSNGFLAIATNRQLNKLLRQPPGGNDYLRFPKIIFIYSRQMLDNTSYSTRVAFLSIHSNSLISDYPVIHRYTISTTVSVIILLACLFLSWSRVLLEKLTGFQLV